MAIPHDVAVDVVTLQVQHLRGDLTDAELTAALEQVAVQVETHADVFELVHRLAGVAAGAVEGMARVLGVSPESLLAFVARNEAPQGLAG